MNQIEENWYDCMYCSIHFKTKENRNFFRCIIIPFGFSEEDVCNMFKLSLKKDIEIIDVTIERDVWISKQHYKKVE